MTQLMQHCRKSSTIKVEFAGRQCVVTLNQHACKQQLHLHLCTDKKKVFTILVRAWLALLQQHAPAVATVLDASVCISHNQCIVWSMRLLRKPSHALDIT